MESTRHVLLVSVGNTRTRVALGSLSETANGQLDPSRVFENSDIPALASAIAEEADRADALMIVTASVNNPVCDALERSLDDAGQFKVQRLGRDLAIPIANTLDDDSTVGHDRLLAALGAFARSRQACIVIDAGTAVTVDFVDGEGTFHGGAIAPGLRMMRDSLHEHTAALPAAEISPKHLHSAGEPPFGKTTVEAINLGVTASVVGLTHLLIDRYAEFYAAYPRVVATGGDAPMLFEHDQLVEHIVPDLVLVGMLAACEIHASGDADADDTDEAA
jgi:type III pantothenate kinase